MKETIQVTYDGLSIDCVFVQTQKPSALPHRETYYNTEDGRKALAQVVSEADMAEILAVWGEMPPEPSRPNPATLQAQKQAEIKAMCEAMITNGFDADVLGRGPLHYSLTQVKQDDLKVLYTQVQGGARAVFWHDDSRVMHELYTADQFLALYQQGMAFIVGCKIRSDGLEQHTIDLFGAGDIDGAMAVDWNTELPAQLQAEVDRQVAMMLGGGGNGAAS